MRVIERALVATLDFAHVGDLDIELRLAQSAPLDEEVDCAAVSDAVRDTRLRNVYVPEGEFSGATRGFLSAGSTRRETIFSLLEGITTDLIRADARSAVVDAAAMRWLTRDAEGVGRVEGKSS